MNPIGVVRSSLRNRVDAPRQGSEGAPDAWILLEPSYADALQGLSVGDELVVLTWLHEADRSVRSSDRPNPIGLHPVTVYGIDGLELAVGPLEAIDGTLVVDLKPLLRTDDSLR